jgi:uncharacterized membrane protein
LQIDSEKLWRGGQQQAVYMFEGLQKKRHLQFCVPTSIQIRKIFPDHNFVYKSIPFQVKWI